MDKLVQPQIDSDSTLCQPVKPAVIFRRNHGAPLWTATPLTNPK